MEQKKSNRTLMIVIVAIILLSICMFVSCCAMGILVFMNSSSGATLETVKVATEEVFVFPTQSVDALTESTEATIHSNSTVTTDNLDRLTEIQKKIIRRAEEIRGLQAKNPVTLVFHSKDQIREALTDQLYQNVTEEDFQNEHALLSMLGLIPESLDLETFYLDLYTEQIAGYYDQEKNQMVLVQGGTETENALTLAHEYTHFLQFEHFNPKEKLSYTNETCEEDPEFCLAISAVMEGDATLTEILLTSEKDLGLYQGIPVSEDVSVFESAPQYFKDSLLFPYTFGYDFVSWFYQRGGYEAVNELYENPPTSIEQIMHPERYPAEEPIEVQLEPFTSAFERQCTPVIDNVLNEADLIWVLGSGYEKNWRLPVSVSKKAVDGWGGGTYQLSRCNDEPLFFGKTVWDTQQDADEFYNALTQYFDLRFEKSRDKHQWSSTNGEQVFSFQQVDLIYMLIAPPSFDPSNVLELLQSGQSL